MPLWEHMREGAHCCDCCLEGSRHMEGSREGRALFPPVSHASKGLFPGNPVRCWINYSEYNFL